MKRLVCSLLCLALIAGVGGCSNRPDDNAIQTAIQANVRANLGRVDQLANRLGGDAAVHLLRTFGSPAPEDIRIAHVDVLDSTALDNDAYDLRVRYDLVTADHVDRVTQRYQLRHAANGHWQAVPLDGDSAD